MPPENPPSGSGPVPAQRRPRSRKRFNLAHSIAGVALLLGLQGAIGGFVDVVSGTHSASIFIILIGSLVGGLFVILIATEVIEEVRKSLHMLVLLSAVVFEFIVFFAVQYWYMSLMVPNSFNSLQINPVDLLLHSTTVFALNPLYLPLTTAAQALLLINTMESLVLGLFVLQNVWQFRNKSAES